MSCRSNSRMRLDIVELSIELAGSFVLILQLSVCFMILCLFLDFMVFVLIFCFFTFNYIFLQLYFFKEGLVKFWKILNVLIQKVMFFIFNLFLLFHATIFLCSQNYYEFSFHCSYHFRVYEFISFEFIAFSISFIKSTLEEPLYLT